MALAAMALTAATTLTACSGGDGKTESATSSAPTSAQAGGDTTAPESLPTAAELNAILAKATDPEASLEEKTQTVQGGEIAPELFDTMAASKAESGATFEVVDPVVPGFTPDSLLTTVQFSLPERPEPQIAENVEFVYEDGQWKLSQSWACTLISNTVSPEEIPAMCNAQPTAAQAPGGDSAEDAPADAPAN
ncbi:hypothetical protein G7Y31_07935 [Corynebacterium lizhenjunii]|uniref:Low molecular weight antigen MTB12-like C-terminal domain-containing protein n=2 Tax=Corynebacterium lizhenjunii TaxID=2709394 RepID=A0A7T0KGX5_9CORY|nr:hypothetical protein G7Y31_07935 [Corynebacterium lizhenjunii]